jgi:anionic cell wall polymer biosynthesis LytR-Cps2A-Psr (LCP) family protein
MSLYTIVFILVTILIVTGLALFGLLISKIDRWIDHKDRVGHESIVKNKTDVKKGQKPEQTSNK